MKLKNHFLVEDQVMVTNTKFVFFPVLNNELSINYGITTFLEAGVFYDLFNDSRSGSYLAPQTRLHLLGIKANLSLFSLMQEVGLITNTRRFDISISGYYGIHRFQKSKYNFDGVYDKKDVNSWSHYYKLGARYFFTSHFYAMASAGLINTNRFFLGIGIKL